MINASILTRKLRSACSLLRSQNAWENLCQKTGENLRSVRLAVNRTKPLIYQYANEFSFAVVPGIPETEELYLRQQRHEATELSVIRKWLEPGDVSVDCGANVGLVSALMAQSVGRTGKVYAVEGCPATATKLDTVLASLRLSQVQVVRKAISDCAGEVIFSNNSSQSVANSIQPNSILTGTASHHGVRVPTVSLEELLASVPRLPALVKLDIEGAEPLAFQGWTSLKNSQDPPAFIFEVFPRGLAELGFTPKDIFACLPLQRYDLWHINFSYPNQWPEFPPGRPFVLDDPFRHVWPMHSNVIALPREGTFAKRATRLQDILPL